MTYLNIIAQIDDKNYTIWRNLVNFILHRIFYVLLRRFSVILVKWKSNQGRHKLINIMTQYWDEKTWRIKGRQNEGPDGISTRLG